MSGRKRGGISFLNLPANVGGAVHGFGNPGRLGIHGDDAAVEEAGFFGEVRRGIGDGGLLLEVIGGAEDDEVAMDGVDVDNAFVEYPAGDGLGLTLGAEDGDIGLTGVGGVGIGEDAEPFAV